MNSKQPWSRGTNWRLPFAVNAMFNLSNVGPTMLGLVAFVWTWLKVSPASHFSQQLPTTLINMQQGVQTDVTCNIQQYWELFANNVASVCTGLNVSNSIARADGTLFWYVFLTSSPRLSRVWGGGDANTQDEFIFLSSNWVTGYKAIQFERTKIRFFFVTFSLTSLLWLLISQNNHCSK